MQHVRDLQALCCLINLKYVQLRVIENYSSTVLTIHQNFPSNVMQHASHFSALAELLVIIVINNKLVSKYVFEYNFYSVTQ